MAYQYWGWSGSRRITFGVKLRASVKNQEGGTVMRTLLKKVSQNQQGITGLETAIILIAFVIVASVFAYVVLSAGLFSSQKAKEAVYAGMKETGSTVEMKGDVIAKIVNGGVTEVYFTIGTRPGRSRLILPILQQGRTR